MSAITYALNELYHVMDRGMLEQAYLYNQNGQASCQFSNLDNVIIDTTLYGRVLRDINIFGGMQKHLCSAHGQIIQSDNFGTVWHYSDVGMNGHTIMTASAFMPGITCLDGINGGSACAMAGHPFPAGFHNNHQRGMQGLVNRLNSVNQHGPRGVVTPRVVAHNSILLPNAMQLASGGTFTVIVTHDDALNDLPPRTWPIFSDLFVSAVKAFIYQTMRSRIARGALIHGQEYNIYTEILQEYSDAEEQYRERRQAWARVAYMNDKERYSTYIRHQTRSL